MLHSRSGNFIACNLCTVIDSYMQKTFEHKHCRKHKCGEVVFPTSTNADKHALSALDSDRTARDNVEIS